MSVKCELNEEHRFAGTTFELVILLPIHTMLAQDSAVGDFKRRQLKQLC